MRRHPKRTQVDPSNPRAWGTSDHSGFIGQHGDLCWQYEWAGFQLINKRILVFEDELDLPNRQLGAIIIPPDPDPIMDARPEAYFMDEEPISTIVTTPAESVIVVGYDGTALESILVALAPGALPTFIGS
jgi:hypothetical protein